MHTFSRRRILGAAAAAGTATIAGCLGGGGTVDSLPRPVAGDPDADVTVSVFEDFACPHCRQFNESVKPRLDDEYISEGRIRYEHFDFPIPVDPEHSWKAASAARSVQDNAGIDQFWTYAEVLYRNQGNLSGLLYESAADQIGVDGGQVRGDADNQTYRPVAESDRETGIDRGVQGTPTVFVNNRVVQATYDAISGAVDAAIE